MAPQAPWAAGVNSPVRRRRKERRMTQAELAAAVGVSRQTVIAIEQGDYSPSVYLAMRIATVLGACVEDLFIESHETGAHETGQVREGTAR